MDEEQIMKILLKMEKQDNLIPDREELDDVTDENVEVGECNEKISDNNDGDEEVDFEELNGQDEEWANRDEGFRSSDFANNSKFRPPNPQPTTEKEFFNFFSYEILIEIYSETNRYAKANEMYCNTPHRKGSIWNSWTDVTLEEINAFIGVLIAMGLHPAPTLQLYFSEKWVHNHPFLLRFSKGNDSSKYFGHYIFHPHLSSKP
ncbi:hypothetical protein ABEB36_014928 [Hypothenemus hampei]|uniref:PiggyBac transposable element-derived protein domain-containing protein n=1 Tax=Hypothenemus hampei TaxID=57062 RepID=A0ABD1E1A1_HYPHA